MIKVKIEQFKNSKQLEINENKLTTITGSNCCGKSFLSKYLNKTLKDSILINEQSNLKLNINSNISKGLEILKKDLNINELLKYNYNHLSYSEKSILNIYMGLLSDKSILIFDDIFSSIDNIKKEKIFKYLKKLSKQKTIINITNDVEETIYGDYIILLNNSEIILNEQTKIILTKEKEFKNCNLDLPFMASLSLKLKYYDLINDLYLDMNKLVDKLWK